MNCLFYLFLFQICLSTEFSSLNSTSIRQKRMARQRGFSNSMKMFGYGTRVEELLNPETYHKYIRPGVDSAAPVNISISMAITSMDKISDADMEYTITFTLYQTWRDDRLESNTRVAKNLTKPVTMDWSVSERMWVPDTYIVNAKTSFIHDVTTKNALLILYPNGTVIYVLRITSRVACPMKLFKYPMDGQICKLRFASWSFSEKDLNYNWSGGKICGGAHRSVMGMENVVLPQFNVTRCDIYATRHERMLGNYSELVMEFGLKRNVRFFFMQTYVPSILLVMLSWVSFWINVNAVPARVALGITTVLSMTTLMIGVYNSGPKSTSYVKAIDLYVLVCYGFIFSAMIEFAGVHYYLRHDSVKTSTVSDTTASKKVDEQLEAKNEKITKQENIPKSLIFTTPAQEENNLHGTKNEPRRKAGSFHKPSVKHVMKVEKIDLFFMVAFPIIFGLFNAIYWGVYLSMQD